MKIGCFWTWTYVTNNKPMNRNIGSHCLTQPILQNQLRWKCKFETFDFLYSENKSSVTWDENTIDTVYFLFRRIERMHRLIEQEYITGHELIRLNWVHFMYELRLFNPRPSTCDISLIKRYVNSFLTIKFTQSKSQTCQILPKLTITTS